MQSLKIMTTLAIALAIALAIGSLAPDDAHAHEVPDLSIRGQFVDGGRPGAREIGGLLNQAFQAAGMRAPRGMLEAATDIYAKNPKAELVLFNERTGASAAADLTGSFEFRSAPLKCTSQACERFAESHEKAIGIVLESLEGTVAVEDGGKIGYALFDRARSMSALDPVSGDMYVEWPVVFKAPEGFPGSEWGRLFPDSIFERGGNAVFRGIGHLEGDQFRATDVARIQGGDGQVMDISNMNTGSIRPLDF